MISQPILQVEVKFSAEINVQYYISTGNIKRIVDKFHTCWNKSSIQYKGVCKRGSGMKFLITLRISEIFRCIVATLRLALQI